MKIHAHLTDDVLLGELGARLAQARLRRPISQAALAREAGISKRTLERIEAGQGGQLTSLVRICRALGLLDALDVLLPDPAPSPLALLERQGMERKRAPRRAGADAAPPTPWTWGDEAGAEPPEDEEGSP